MSNNETVLKCQYCGGVLGADYDIDVGENKQWAYSHVSQDECIEILLFAEQVANKVIDNLNERMQLLTDLLEQSIDAAYYHTIKNALVYKVEEALGVPFSEIVRRNVEKENGIVK